MRCDINAVVPWNANSRLISIAGPCPRYITRVHRCHSRVPKGHICSETYLCIGPFNTQPEAESALSYLSCRLTRLLILLHKPSQDTTRKVYTFVPTQEWTQRWTDEDLYAKYGISASEIEFIEKVVRPMDLTSDLFGDVAIGESDDE